MFDGWVTKRGSCSYAFQEAAGGHIFFFFFFFVNNAERNIIVDCEAFREELAVGWTCRTRA